MVISGHEKITDSFSDHSRGKTRIDDLLHFFLRTDGFTDQTAAFGVRGNNATKTKYGLVGGVETLHPSLPSAKYRSA